MSAVTELAATIGAQAACGVLAVPRASYYRHRKPRTAPPRQVRVRSPSPCALSAAERQVVLDTLHGERFQDRSAGHVVAALLSEDTWLCSERTMYRILAAQGETQERRRQRQHPVYVKPQLRADAPNQVWTRDYTKVRGPARGIWFHLFVLLDLFSRCVVGWTLARRPSAAVARHLLRQSMAQHNVAAGTLTVHNDRGSEFVADEAAYCARYALSDEQTTAVLERDWQAMLDLGGSIFYVYKLAMMDGLSMQYLGGVFTGMSEDEFKAAMLAGGRTDV